MIMVIVLAYDDRSAIPLYDDAVLMIMVIVLAYDDRSAIPLYDHAFVDDHGDSSGL
jgi:hypothetical protein